MNITDRDIAECALCSYGAVRKAKSDGRLGTFEDVVAFCVSGRLKKRGVGFLDNEKDLGYTPMAEHEFSA